jgi:predicted dinucleotide-binding enzyme
MSTRIAVIGTGNVGGNLGARLSNAGFPVRFGVRDDKDTPALLAKCAKDAQAVSPAAAAEWAEVVFLAVPAPAAAELARSLPLAGKVVVDATNPLTWQDGPVWNPPKEGSVAAAIAAAAPNARVIKGFNQFGAEFHADPTTAAGRGGRDEDRRVRRRLRRRARRGEAPRSAR